MSPEAAHPALVEIQRLFDTRGALVYGEAVTQIEHALQCGTLAEQQAAPVPLVLAAWLHDIGHMQHRDPEAAVNEGRDDAHETLGSRFLERWFGPDVAEPVRLHVDAKRYLCATDAGYRDQLSPISKRTLEIQGGPMSGAEVDAFERVPYSADAVRLRRWDDAGKQPGMATRPFEHFMALAARGLRTD